VSAVEQVGLDLSGQIATEFARESKRARKRSVMNRNGGNHAACVSCENRNARDSFASVQTGLPFEVGAVSVLGATGELQRLVEATGNAEYGLDALAPLHTASKM